MLAMWPSLPGFELEDVSFVDDEYVLVARSTEPCTNNYTVV